MKHLTDKELKAQGIFYTENGWEYWIRPAQNTLAKATRVRMRRRPGRSWKYDPKWQQLMKVGGKLLEEIDAL